MLGGGRTFPAKKKDRHFPRKGRSREPTLEGPLRARTSCLIPGSAQHKPVESDRKHGHETDSFSQVFGGPVCVIHQKDPTRMPDSFLLDTKLIYSASGRGDRHQEQ